MYYGLEQGPCKREFLVSSLVPPEQKDRGCSPDSRLVSTTARARAPAWTSGIWERFHRNKSNVPHRWCPAYKPRWARVSSGFDGCITRLVRSCTRTGDLKWAIRPFDRLFYQSTTLPVRPQDALDDSSIGYERPSIENDLRLFGNTGRGPGSNTCLRTSKGSPSDRVRRCPMVPKQGMDLSSTRGSPHVMDQYALRIHGEVYRIPPEATVGWEQPRSIEIDHRCHATQAFQESITHGIKP